MEEDDVGDESPELQTELISRRAELFRSKMLHDFHLLENLGAEHELDPANTAPYLSSKDVMDERRSAAMMISEPYTLIKLEVNNQKAQRRVSTDKRRLARVRNRHARFPAIDIIAHRIVKSTAYTVFVTIVMVINALIVGVDVQLRQNFINKQFQIKLDDDDDVEEPAVPEYREPYTVYQLAIDISTSIVLIIFVLDIILKLIDNHRVFWSSKWNIYDLLLTIFSASVQTIRHVDKIQGVEWRYNLLRALSCLRVFRSLRIITLYKRFEICLTSITRASREILFIGAFMFIIGYMYAMFGVTFFDYTTITDESATVMYPQAFCSVLNSLETVFMIATNDHWLQLIKEASLTQQTGGAVIAYFFVSSWLFVGAFVLSNFITGSIARNYATTRAQLVTSKQQEAEAARIALDQRNQLKDKIDEEATLAAVRRFSPNISASSSALDHRRVSAGYDGRASLASASSNEDEDWKVIVENNMSNIALGNSTSRWPADILFQYYTTMEALQENIEERKQILRLVTQVLLSFHDTN